ncbi:MAG: DUF308 domain-containing protein [Bacilli bacterium]
MGKTKRVIGPISPLTGISIALIILGALLVWLRTSALNIIIFVIGVVMASFGAITVFDSLKGRNKDKFIFLLGGFEMVVGVLMAVFSDPLVKVGFVLLGVAMALIGLLQLIDNYRFHTGSHQLAFGIIRMAIGVLLIIAPFIGSNIKDIFILVVGIIAISAGVFFLMLED